MTPTSIVAYLVLFASVAFLFVFVALLLGRFLRPRAQTPEKQEIYECGEPTIGSGFVQFDLRFYVVALVFIIFEVEVAFLFPWAIVFGKANQLRSQPAVEARSDPAESLQPIIALTADAKKTLHDLGVRRPSLPSPSGGLDANARGVDQAADRLALAAMIDMGVFFVVLLVAFAYVWSRGDLDWVRACEFVARSQAADLKDVSTAVSSPSLR